MVLESVFIKFIDRAASNAIHPLVVVTVSGKIYAKYVVDHKFVNTRTSKSLAKNVSVEESVNT